MNTIDAVYLDNTNFFLNTTIQRPAKIFLVRHGQSQWNGQKRVSGQCDPPLAPKGIQQAHCLARVLGHETLSAIYTSPLRRAVETAGPTAVDHQLAIQTREALKEIHFGVLQGRFRDERDPEAQHLWEARQKDKGNYRIPGGETFPELEQRVIPCLITIFRQEAGRTILIVGHRNTNRVIMAALMHWPREIALQLNLRSKYLYEITAGQEFHLKTICLDKSKLGRTYEEFRM